MKSNKLNKSESKYYNTACLMDEALILLLEKKEYEFITVKEICKKAGVNRSTFYLHYESIDDLLRECIVYVGNKVANQFDKNNLINIKQIQTCPIEDLLLVTPKYLMPYLEFVKTNKAVFKAAALQPYVFRNQEITGHLYKTVFEPILARFQVPENERKYFVTFYLNGLGAVMLEWVKGGCKEEVQIICNLIARCVDKQI